MDLLERDKLGVDRDERAPVREFCRQQRLVLDKGGVAIPADASKSQKKKKIAQFSSRAYREMVMSWHRMLVSVDSGREEKSRRLAESMRW